MAREVWLRPNRRIFIAAMAIVAVAAVLAGVVPVALGWPATVKVAGWILVLPLLGVFILLVHRARQPRLAYEDGHLLVYLGTPQPYRVPIAEVECFFLGQGPSMLRVPIFARQQESPESSMIVVRLAEAAEEWKHREVRPDHGLWCDGYITIRGTMCEPIHGDRMRELNHRLVEVHREQRGNRERESA